MKKTLIVAAVFVFVACSAFAVPNLQLYIPGGTYNHQSDTWITSSHSFELWVIASNMNRTGDIYNLTLTGALAQHTDAVNGALSITRFGGTTRTFNASDYHYGTPPSSGPDAGDLGRHGIYPTNYVEYLVANRTSSPYEPTQNMPDPGDRATGNIFKFNVTSSYRYIHFDAYGYLRCDDGRFINAPFSHDAEMSAQSSHSPVPEPATMVLFGLGLVGAGIVRRAKK